MNSSEKTGAVGEFGTTKPNIDEAMDLVVAGLPEDVCTQVAERLPALVTAVRREAAQTIRESEVASDVCCGPDGDRFADLIDPDIDWEARERLMRQTTLRKQALLEERERMLGRRWEIVRAEATKAPFPTDALALRPVP
ncbi:hypothetical protein [Streptomyces sp. NPDC007083]|uniref:hypothetical protein n=1 Tax=Streptomyces sp. NPDC007083 TaxID=3156913 RepID=UPI0033EAC6F1